MPPPAAVAGPKFSNTHTHMAPWLHGMNFRETWRLKYTPQEGQVLCAHPTRASHRDWDSLV